MNKKVLIVDDKQDLALNLENIVKNYLTDWEIDLITKRTNTENLFERSLEYIKNNEYGLVVTDLILDDNQDPRKQQGIEIARHAREKNPTSAIAVVSSYLNNFLSNKQLSSYYKLNLEYFDRGTIPNEHFKDLLTNYLYKLEDPEEYTKIEKSWLKPKSIDKFSYWIMLVYNLDDKKEISILNAFLLWANLYAKSEADFHVLTSGDPLFSDICEKEHIEEFPTLIMSNKPDMEDKIILRPEGLIKLIEKEEDFRKFLVRFHLQMKHNGEISNIRNQLKSKEFKEFIKQLFKKIDAEEFINLIIKENISKGI